MTTRAGCSYFGVRIPRHVRRDMADLAARGYTGVLHTFSENDLAYYRGTMAEIVAASHAEGLWVQASPWGLGRTFGGEAESRWVAFHPEECQVLDDGRRVAAACLNSAAYREFCKEWADWALECGVDAVFWDEPAWVVPAHVGVDEPARWTCRCERCAERFGAPIPGEPTPEVRRFREDSVVDFLRELVAHVAARGGASTVCLLPATEGTQGLADWDDVAGLPGLATLATDPYWKHWDEAAGAFVRRFARLLRETAARNGVGAQLWVPSFGLEAGDVPDLEAGVAGAREEGVEDLWTWGYEACRHMTHLATPDAPLVWEAVSKALTGRSEAVTETARPGLADLDLRSTPELVRLLNEEDATVPAAVAEAGDELAAAIDAIVERLRRGGRLVYVGAGTSGALAALDAAECGSTFASPPGEVVAVTAEGDADEDDRAAATNALLELPLRPEDCVVAVSASGSTPFVLAALEVARETGALRVAVASVRGSRAASLAEHEVAAVVGPEVVAGSTRLKAGTAQKLVLNTISTVTMIRLGRTYGGLMVNVAPGNEKLRERARRNVVLASGASEDRVDEALEAAAGDARVALVSLLAGVDAGAARTRLDAAGGSVRKAAEE
ncbi:MAG TPA: N-acetylmuramic acid 6-phosphate etherase [Gaiellaceae bacterium]|nr:N-acetylmuramic acid 6-phosphate etherase [Gaiellaceae bacterium]